MIIGKSKQGSLLKYKWKGCPNWIALDPGDGCELIECPHHVHYIKMGLRVNKRTGVVPRITKSTLNFKNCMCLAGGHSFTLEEIGDVFGMTRERVRQVEEKVLVRIKHKSKYSTPQSVYDELMKYWRDHGS